MIRRFLHSKIHRATVTETDLDYIGSLTLDPDLMDVAQIVEFEQVDVYNITRGTRFTTYSLKGKRGSGEMCVNGAAAHLAEVGDFIIVATYCDLHEQEIGRFEPVVIHVDENNRPVS